MCHVKFHGTQTKMNKNTKKILVASSQDGKHARNFEIIRNQESGVLRPDIEFIQNGISMELELCEPIW